MTCVREAELMIDRFLDVHRGVHAGRRTPCTGIAQVDWTGLSLWGRLLILPFQASSLVRSTCLIISIQYMYMFFNQTDRPHEEGLLQS